MFSVSRCLFFFLLGLLVLSGMPRLLAQPLQVTAGQSPEELVRRVLSRGDLRILSVEYSGRSQQIGRFNDPSGQLGFSSGVLFSTGNVADAVGPNTLTGIGLDGQPDFLTDANTLWETEAVGDPNLAGLEPNEPFFDRVYLRIRFIPQTDQLGFRFVFASEEYPEFTPPRDTIIGSLVNDLFGFFITGPGFPQPTNIATLAGGEPISIRNINAAINSNLYRPNEDRSTALWQTTRYDGMSTVFNIEATVVPCQTYEIYLVLADVTDNQYDTGLFFEAGSFGGEGLTVTAQGLDEDPVRGAITYEGCGPGTASITLERTPPLDVPRNLTVRYAGTTTAGLDYAVLPTNLTFPVGASTIDLSVITFWDNIFSPTEDDYESLILIFDDPTATCPEFQIISDTLWIKQTDTLRLTPIAPASGCVPTDLTLSTEITGGTGTYLYQWLNGVSNLQSNPNVNVRLENDSTFQILALDARCTDVPVGFDSVFVSGAVRDPNAPPLAFTSFPADIDICRANPVNLAPVVEGGTGTYNYTWEPTGETTATIDVSPNTTTRYRLRVSDGCDEIIDSVDVRIYAPLQLRVEATPKGPICSGTNVQLTAFATGGAGNYNFAWEDNTAGPNRIVSPTDTTRYSVIVSDRCGNAIESIAIFVYPELAITMPNDTIICEGKSVTLRPRARGGDGRYTFLWDNSIGSNPAPVVTPPRTTTYRIVLNDGCGNFPVVEDVVVTVLDRTEPLNIIGVSGPDTLCPGESGTYNVLVAGGTGSFAYRVNGGPLQASNAFVLTPANPTRYTFEVVDTCDVFAFDKVIEFYVSPTMTLATDPEVVCVGAAATLTPTIRGGKAPYDYVWSSGADTPTLVVNPTQTTTYQLTVTDACGFAPIAAAVEVRTAEPLAVTITGARDVCPNESLTLTAEATGGDGNYLYAWSTGRAQANLIVNPTESRSYSVTITDGCGSTPATFEVFINLLPGVTLSLGTSPPIQCVGRAMEVRFNGFAPPDAQFVWDFGNLNVTGSDRGPFLVISETTGSFPVRLQVTSSRCGNADSTFLLRFEEEPVAFFEVPGSQCFGGHAFDFEAGPLPDGATVLWDFGTLSVPPTATTRSVLGVQFPAAGIFSIELTVRVGDCSDTQSSEIEIRESPTAPLATADTICNGYTAQHSVLNPNPDWSYQWFDQASGGTVLANGTEFKTPVLLRNTTWYIEATGPNGCKSVPRGTATTEVRGAGKLDFTTNKDTAEIPLAVITFTPSFDREPQFWKWTFGDGFEADNPNPVHQFSNPGSYDVSLTVTDTFGCVTSVVKNDIVHIRDPGFLQVPTAFSPDDNYVNDEWYVVHKLIRDFEVWVFDRSGNVVFNSKDVNFRWYGEVRGRDIRTRVLEGVYVYRIKAKTYNGTDIDLNGNLTVFY